MSLVIHSSGLVLSAKVSVLGYYAVEFFVLPRFSNHALSGIGPFVEWTSSREVYSSSTLCVNETAQPSFHPGL